MWPFKKPSLPIITHRQLPIVKPFPEVTKCESKHHTDEYVVLLIQEPWSGKWYMKRWYYDYDLTLTKRCEERQITQFKHELEEYFRDSKKEPRRTESLSSS